MRNQRTYPKTIVLALILGLTSFRSIYGENIDRNIEIDELSSVYLGFERNGEELIVEINPIVDEFSRMLLSDAYNKSINDELFNRPEIVLCETDADVGNAIFHDLFSVKTESKSSLYSKSFSKSICKEAASSTAINRVYQFERFFFPLSTAVLTVDEGVITQIAFDDTCFSCSSASEMCIANAVAFANETETESFLSSQPKGGVGFDCGLSEKECADNPSLCDFVVFVVWRGTDINGESLRSSAKRISRFEQFNLQQIQDFISI